MPITDDGNRDKSGLTLSPDGTRLAYVEGRGDLVVTDLDGENRREVVQSWNAPDYAWSPDGKWLAYVSDESGRDEVYVQPFPAKDEKWQISSGGGAPPVWGPDGEELFYLCGGAMMVAKIETEPSFQPGVPSMLFESPDYDVSILDWVGFDVSKDSQRFLLCKSNQALREPLRELIVVENWFEELKRLVPTD